MSLKILFSTRRIFSFSSGSQRTWFIFDIFVSICLWALFDFFQASLGDKNILAEGLQVLVALVSIWIMFAALEKRAREIEVNPWLAVMFGLLTLPNTSGLCA